MSNNDIEIKEAAKLSLTEIGLGSLGHGFKIPLTGQVLSLNQLGFLLNAVNRHALPKSAVFEISSIAAILKSFSPAGQKLGPMLSIAMQGFLFWLGLAIFGMNIIGQAVGAFLLALWAFVQPFITLFMIYGFDLVKLVQFYIERVQEDYAFIAASLAVALLLVISIKIILALALVFYSRGFKKEIKLIRDNKLQELILQQMPDGKNNLPAWRGALKDLLKPLFLFSFLLMMVFVWQINGGLSQKIWLSLRPLAIAFLIFYLIRSPWVAAKLFSLTKKSKTFESLYLKAQGAMDLLKKK